MIHLILPRLINTTLRVLLADINTSTLDRGAIAMHPHHEFLFLQIDLISLQCQLLMLEVHLLLEYLTLLIHIPLHFVLHLLEVEHLLLLQLQLRFHTVLVFDFQLF